MALPSSSQLLEFICFYTREKNKGRLWKSWILLEIGTVFWSSGESHCKMSLFLGALVVVGFFSTREFLSWYLKIGPISRKQKALEKTLAQISEDLGKIQKRLDGQEAPAQPPPSPPPTPEKRFLQFRPLQTDDDLGNDPPSCPAFKSACSSNDRRILRDKLESSTD